MAGMPMQSRISPGLRNRLLALLAGVAAIALGPWACSRAGGEVSFSQWRGLIAPDTLDGWRIATGNGHGNTQAWTVADGVITGTQDKPGNGGVLITDGVFRDFLMEIEFKVDWGLDSGIFLRSTPEGRCYQIMLDCYPGGNVGGIYGEGTGGFIARAEDWEAHHRRDDWNKILAVVTGNPPTIEVWLNGHHAMSWTGTERLLDDAGHLAVQVHAGAGYFGKEARFRNLRVRELAPAAP